MIFVSEHNGVTDYRYGGAYLNGFYPRFCENWNILMPMSMDLNVFLNPTDHPEFGKPYKASEKLINEDGLVVERHISHSKTPQRAIAICCINVLLNK